MTSLRNVCNSPTPHLCTRLADSPQIPHQSQPCCFCVSRGFLFFFYCLSIRFVRAASRVKQRALFSSCGKPSAHDRAHLCGAGGATSGDQLLCAPPRGRSEHREGAARAHSGGSPGNSYHKLRPSLARTCQHVARGWPNAAKFGNMWATWAQYSSNVGDNGHHRAGFGQKPG